MRRGSAGMPPLPWPATLALEDELGVDSLERYALATALSSCLDMRHGDIGYALLHATSLHHWCDCARASLEQAGAGLTFRTSGSSGVPTDCVHRLDLLWQEALFFASQLRHARRVVFAVPAHHIYGFLFTVLLPLALGTNQLVLVDARSMLPAQLRRQVMTGDVMVGFPQFWAGLAAPGYRWPAGVTGVSSTGPCPQNLALRLGEAGLSLLEVYGSSQTGGIGWRTDPLAPYALLPFWERVATAQAVQRATPDGVWHSCVCQDTIAWHGDSHFVPGERVDQAVQVGGINVYPAQVAALIKRHPAVRDAHVRLMRADEGQRLKAFVVPGQPDVASALADQLTAWVRERLPPAARPVSFTVGAALPVNRQGKLADWIIDEPDGAGHPALLTLTDTRCPP